MKGIQNVTDRLENTKEKLFGGGGGDKNEKIKVRKIKLTLMAIKVNCRHFNLYFTNNDRIQIRLGLDIRFNRYVNITKISRDMPYFSK